MPQKKGRNGLNRPFGPFGVLCVQSCWAISGASRFATAQVLGGFMISEPLPETIHLLFEASSQAETSGGRNWRSEEHTYELQSLMRISYAVFCLTKKNDA